MDLALERALALCEETGALERGAWGLYGIWGGVIRQWLDELLPDLRRHVAEQRHAHQARQEGALRHAADEAREAHGRLVATCDGLAERLRAVEP